MICVPDRPEYGQGKNGICTGFQREAGTVRRRKQGKRPALLQAGRKDDIREIRLNELFSFIQVIQVPVMKRIVFRDDA